MSIENICDAPTTPPPRDPLSPNLTIPVTESSVFVRCFQGACAEAFDNAFNKGFWDGPQNFGEKVALVHSELSEALEGHRHGNPPDDKVPEFSSVEAELADAVIRIMDMSERYKFRVAEAIVAKMKFNRGRPYKHGKTC